MQRIIKYKLKTGGATNSKYSTSDPLPYEEFHQNVQFLYDSCGERPLNITTGDGITLPCGFRLEGVELVYWQDAHRTEVLHPFLVVLRDFETAEYNGNCFFNNVHRTDHLTGSQIVSAVLEVLRWLKAKNVSITDGTRVNFGETDQKAKLSIYKFFERGSFFYQRFGFRPTPRKLKHKLLFHNSEQAEEAMRLLHGKVVAIPCQRVIHDLSRVVDLLTRGGECTIFLGDPFSGAKFDVRSSRLVASPEKKESIRTEAIESFSKVIEILRGTPDSLLCEILKKLWDEKHPNYMVLEKHLLTPGGSPVVGITTSEESAWLDIINLFDQIDFFVDFLFVRSFSSESESGPPQER